MPVDALDESLLLRAVELARSSIGLSEPNPRVGCVLRNAHGAAAGEGCTQQAGGPHAEIVALQAAAAAGVDVRGGTAWVSLEPCAHHGRTPPCCDALAAAGLRRVVVAMQDPFEQVAGRGLERLRAAGVAVDLAEGGAAVRAARELNVGFLSRVLRHRPWVRMKVAASLDARTALDDGRSQWITGPPARIDGHRWRQRAGAILTGIGTVRDDDPRLDVREVPTVVQPRRVVVDSSLAIAPTARILQPPGEALVVHAGAPIDRVAALRERGVAVDELPGADGRVDLRALLAKLATDGVNELHVEAGAVLNAALINLDLVDELLLYVAPKLIGPGRPIAALDALPSLDDAPGFRFVDVSSVGDDLRLIARRPASAAFVAPPAPVSPR
jgi:diaminohydroxyphosphoribosylaminopyrimidine deaminase/5-amino-6-(5-phosphoribosylamino)uracil reductase